MTLARKASSG